MTNRRERTKEVLNLIGKMMSGKISKQAFAEKAREWDAKYPNQGWDKVVDKFGIKDKPPF